MEPVVAREKSCKGDRIVPGFDVAGTVVAREESCKGDRIVPGFDVAGTVVAYHLL